MSIGKWGRMTKRCTICDHKSRAQIEADLVSRADTQEAIAKRYGTTRRALGAHKNNHMDQPTSLAEEQESAPDVLGQLTGTTQERFNKLIEIAAALLSRALKLSSVDTQIRGLSELRKVIELMEKVAGNLPADTEVQILQVIVNDGSQTSTTESGRPEQVLLRQP